MITTRISKIIKNESEIKDILKRIQGKKIKLRLNIGLDKLSGTILKITEDRILLDVTGKAADYFNERINIDVRVNVSFVYENFYYNFDAVIENITDDKVYDIQKNFFWILKYPAEIRKNTNRSIRIKPLNKIFAELLFVSPSDLKKELSSFSGIPEMYMKLREIDKYILLADEFDQKFAFKLIGDELKRISFSTEKEKNYEVVLKDSIGEEQLYKIKEVWIEDIKKSDVENKPEYKNKTSIVITHIKNQLNQIEGYIKLTTPVGSSRLRIIDRDYIKALGTRILAAYKKYKNISNMYKIKDISEDGIAIEGDEKNFSMLEKGMIIRDLRLHLDSHNPETYVKATGEVIRRFQNILAMRLSYSDFGSRLKVREFVNTTLKIIEYQTKLQ